MTTYYTRLSWYGKERNHLDGCIYWITRHDQNKAELRELWLSYNIPSLIQHQWYGYESYAVKASTTLRKLTKIVGRGLYKKRYKKILSISPTYVVRGPYNSIQNMNNNEEKMSPSQQSQKRSTTNTIKCYKRRMQ